MKLSEISRVISHALRHEPWVYELEIDEGGWVSVDALLQAIRETREQWKSVDLSAIEKIIDDTEDKQRFEIHGDKIRAIYGHSTPQKLVYTPTEPPPILYHGTTKDIAELILKEGLKPMSRQYVHFSTNEDIAKEVAKRKGADFVILHINAQKAHKEGVEFYAGNKFVWLCGELSPKFIVMNK